MVFKLVFQTLFRGFPTCSESKYFQSKGEFIKECFKREFLEFSSTISFPVFSHKHLSYPLLYLPIGICCERILGDQELWSPKFIFVSLRRWTVVFALFWVLVGTRCFKFGCELVVWGAASASLWGFRVYGLGSPRDCRCCGTEWSGGIDYSGNPSCVEGGDVEQVCSNLETNPLCLWLLTLSLSLFVSLVYILHTFIIVFIFHAWYIVCLIDICLGIVC